MKKIYRMRYMLISILSFCLGVFITRNGIIDIGFVISAVFGVWLLWFVSYDNQMYKSKRRKVVKR